MAKHYANEFQNPPEELIALCGMLDIEWTYVHGYAGRCWQLIAHTPLAPGLPSRSMWRRTQSTNYEDWVKILDELIAFRDTP